MATAPQKMKVKTLEGETLAVEVLPTNTVKELRAMLLESKGYESVTIPESVMSIGEWANWRMQLFKECHDPWVVD